MAITMDLTMKIQTTIITIWVGTIPIKAPKGITNTDRVRLTIPLTSSRMVKTLLLLSSKILLSVVKREIMRWKSLRKLGIPHKRQRVGEASMQRGISFYLIAMVVVREMERISVKLTKCQVQFKWRKWKIWKITMIGSSRSMGM